MEVVPGGQAEVAQVLHGVAGPLHGAQEQVVDHILGRLVPDPVQDRREPGRGDLGFFQGDTHGRGRLGEGFHLVRVR